MGQWITLIIEGKARRFYNPSGRQNDIRPIDYFSKIIRWCSGRMTSFCVRCACKIGPQALEPRLYEFDGLLMCYECCKRKSKGERNHPDIEDLTPDELNWLKEQSKSLDRPPEHLL